MLVERTPSYALASVFLGKERNGIGFVGYWVIRTPPAASCWPRSTGTPWSSRAAHVRAKVKATVERFELSGTPTGRSWHNRRPHDGVQHRPHHGDSLARAWFVQQLGLRMPGTKVLDPATLQRYEV